jgi:hypothetical protein
MATIKLQNGKVITKDGKVSCECCGVECCLYPAQRLQDGLYPAADLPDTIDFYGSILSRSEFSWGNTTNGVILEIGKWASYRNESRSERDCLFSGSTKDVFKDVYRVNVANFDGSPSTGLVYRDSIGFWTGEQDCGKSLSLTYFGCIQGGTPVGINTNPTWTIAWEFCNPPPGGQSSDSWLKIGSQSQGTPVGNYGPLGIYSVQEP